VAKAKKLSLLERINNGPKRPRAWLEMLTESQRKELLEIRRLVQAGECYASSRCIYDEVTKEFPLPITYHTFRIWIRGR